MGTLLHRYWDCPGNENISHEAVDASRRLAPRALKGDHLEQSVWTRPIVPMSWYKCSLSPLGGYCCSGIPTGELHQPEGGAEVVFASDGSGGPCGNDPRLRRVGYASVKVSLGLDGSFNLHWAKFGGSLVSRLSLGLRRLDSSSRPFAPLVNRAGVWLMPSMSSTVIKRATSRQWLVSMPTCGLGFPGRMAA